ncbi:glycosyltransferase family 2 protein [Aeromonas rivipollensis]|uniref:glycosyltransferase family 2 protein n=1 Tax=Aeromonas rivipollensis TaxID=948519 RepID=UPI0038D0DFC6
MKVSLLVNTLNEELNLEKNIKPLSRIFDEIVVVDMSSDDNSVSVANTFATKVISVKRLGYVEPARKCGIDACSNRIVMILDADEVISDKMKQFIMNVRNDEVNMIGNVFFIPRKNRMIGKDIEYGQFKPDSDKQLRLFDKDCVLITDEIHKGIIPKNRTNSLEYKNGFFIYHYHSDTAIEFVARLVKYCEFERAKKVGDDSFVVLSTIKSFVREYFKKQGYRNGRHGFAIAFILSIRTFINGRQH